MGLYLELGIEEGMNREQLVKQLFSARKKWNLRQNAPDMQKRQEAEKILDVITSLQNAVDGSVDTFPGVQLLIQTYGHLYDYGMLNKDAKISIEAAASGSGPDAGHLGDFFYDIGREDLQKQWIFWAADCGAVGAYQVCGALLMESEPEMAIKWFEKAAQANALNESNLYNWGLMYCRIGLFTQAREKLEKASAAGLPMAPWALGKMYENGHGVDVNLEMALRQYQLAKQRGDQEAQADIIRVTNLLNRQKNSQQSKPATDSQTPQPAEQQKTAHETEGGRKSTIPNLEDITIDSLKEKINIDEIKGKVENLAEKVNVGEIKGKVENLAENVDTEKIRKLPWKKIIIVVIGCWVVISGFRSCAVRLSASADKMTADGKVQEMAQISEKTDKAEEAEEETTDELEGKVLTEDVLGPMQQQVEQHISRETDSWGDTSHLMGSEYIGNYVLYGKSGEQVEYPYQIYLVYRVWIVLNDDYSDIIPYYYLVNFPNVSLSEAGEWDVNPMKSRPENEVYDVAYENGISGGWVVNGYPTIEELYASVIKEQLENYQCLTDLDEEKLVNRDFQQAGLTDPKIEKWGQFSGEGVTEDGMYEYNAMGDTVTITKYVGEETEVVIPDELVYRDRIILGAQAFQGSNVTSVTLSDSVVEIASGYTFNSVFGNVTTLESVYISGSVGKISAYTFDGCTNLKEVVIEEGVTTIEKCAFKGCTSLETLELPPTVNLIEEGAVSNTAITKLSVKTGCKVDPDSVKHWTEPIEIEYYD